MSDKPGRGTNPFDPTAERVEELKAWVWQYWM